MKTKTDYANLNHLSDKDSDICECDDNHCPNCFGTCRNPAEVTMYRIDQQDETGTRMCTDCATDAFESGLFESDEN